MDGSKRTIKSAVYHICILAICFVMIYPVLWMILKSFTSASSIVDSSLFAFSEGVNFNNYLEGWRGFGANSFAVFFKNSFVVTIATVAGQVAASAIAAYGFSRIRFKGSRLWFSCMIVTLMLPQQVLIVPQYIIFSKLGWINSFKPLIVPALFGYPFFIFLMMQFIQGIPIELDESAKIDGCNKYSIFYRIILPLIKPAITTSIVFSFYWSWQDFFGPLLFIQSPEKYTVSLALRLFTDPSTVTNWGAVFAMSTLSLLPVFILFLFSQKYMVEGISLTGLKG